MKNNSKHPPRLARWLFRRMTGYQEMFSISGDVDEVFQSICREEGFAKAYIWYWYQCIASLLKYFINGVKWSAIMFKNYLKIAFRTIRREKLYSTINILGLSVGIACSILIMMWVQYELSYDRFHVKADRIYRVGARGTIGDTYNNQTGTPPPKPQTAGSHSQ